MARYATRYTRLLKNLDKTTTTPSPPPAPTPIPPETGEYTNERRFATPGTYTFTAPSSRLRVRVWGAGSAPVIGFLYNNNPGQVRPDATVAGGAGGGFSMGVFTGIAVNSNITVIVGSPGSYAYDTGLGNGQNSVSSQGGTSSFGGLLSATGGTSQLIRNFVFNADDPDKMYWYWADAAMGGSGQGGTINYTGGKGTYIWRIDGNGVDYYRTAGGGVASMFGNGGNASRTPFMGSASSIVAAMGGGAGANSYGAAGDGGSGVGGAWINGTPVSPTDGKTTLDYIGTGGGGSLEQAGANGGGGGGMNGAGGFPGGGSGGGGATQDQYIIPAARPGGGLVIVEW